MRIRYRRVARPVMAAVAMFLSVCALASQARAQEYLFFSSDVHDKRDDLLTHIGSQCLVDGANRCDVIGLVGDFNSQDPTVVNSNMGDIGWLSINIYNLFNWQLGDLNLAYSQGNHDHQNELFSSEGSNLTGPVPLQNNQFYDLYRINSKDFDSACAALNNHLATVTNKMLFVMSHYPLHSNRSDINQTAADCIFGALDTAALAGQDITFLWGHNHFREGRPNYDENVKMIATPGQTIKTDSGNSYLNARASQQLNFSYVNAGYSKTGSSTLFMLHDAWMIILRNGAGAEGAWVTR